MKPTEEESKIFLSILKDLFNEFGIVIEGGCKGCGALKLWKPESHSGNYEQKSVNGFDGFKWEQK